MKVKLTFDFVFPGLNDYTNRNRANKHAGATLKRDFTERVAWIALGQRIPKFRNPVLITFYWREPNRRRDPDNIAFAKKFILDGLVHAGVIENDTWKYVMGFVDHFKVSDEPGVTIIIEDIMEAVS